jgi:2-polyprenyl-6-methoxyphenol hydroxylase-like FAD-dependent oxidoreductase
VTRRMPCFRTKVSDTWKFEEYWDLTIFTGAGAGQAIEDGYILGRALSSYLQTRQHRDSASLGRWMGLYQAFRLPRAQKSQETAPKLAMYMRCRQKV